MPPLLFIVLFFFGFVTGGLLTWVGILKLSMIHFSKSVPSNNFNWSFSSNLSVTSLSLKAYILFSICSILISGIKF